MKRCAFAAATMLAVAFATAAVLAAPTWEKGKVLFKEDFSKDLSQWTYTEGAWEIADGKLRPLESGNYDVILCNIGVNEWKDYVLEYDADIMLEAGSYSQPVFRATDVDNFYMWQYDAEGSYAPNTIRIHIRKDAVWDVPETVDLPKAMVPGRYHIAIEVFGDTIRSYLDGQLVNEYYDDSFATGTIGFRWSALDGDFVDNVVVTELVKK